MVDLKIVQGKNIKLYDVAYRCTLCSKVMRLGKAVKLEYNDLPALCGTIVQQKQFRGNPYFQTAPFEVPCKCTNGNCGIAYFAGLIEVKGEL